MASLMCFWKVSLWSMVKPWSLKLWVSWISICRSLIDSVLGWRRVELIRRMCIRSSLSEEYCRLRWMALDMRSSSLSCCNFVAKSW